MNRVKTYLAQAALTPDNERTYGQNLSYFAEWWNGGSASEVTPDDYTEFLETKPTWGDSQQHNTLAALKSYIRYAYGEKDETNRTREILLHRVRREEPGKQRTPTLEEIDKLIGCCDLKRLAHMRDISMLLVTLDCRLRSKEICNLKVGEIDFETNTLETRRKGGKQAAGKFGPLTSAYLQAWIRERKTIAKPGVEEIFVNVQGIHKGKKMTRSHWRVTCRRWAKRAGIPHFSPHSLCRSMAVITTIAGAPKHLIELAGGWKPGSGMVPRYTKALKVQAIDPYLPSRQLKVEPPGSSQGAPRGSDHE